MHLWATWELTGIGCNQLSGLCRILVHGSNPLGQLAGVYSPWRQRCKRANPTTEVKGQRNILLPWKAQGGKRLFFCNNNLLCISNICRLLVNVFQMNGPLRMHPNWRTTGVQTVLGHAAFCPCPRGHLQDICLCLLVLSLTVLVFITP